ncbi:sugar phosphate isomerase/epimerase [Oceaniovalibus sp. ACAM 378]|jgi:D-psicose/D-tagatose/L-ribulose 3-epimerase|uniref:sugar phosphate isomerase/epimerase family protein n=1 Tax=Oceaniovalibus sp. ACAM 378 TaxID=2599923 RepID=UPI0011D47A51|nr:sugar phosphate isomerase/epimerase [Oceaniovalibus sp. ACAM 378]TYB90780.1 sugar phosphate isomerase/epimerase [Oceaniovalibus sp. ACAM 378]
MQGFGVHTSMWTMNWDREGAERTIPSAAEYKMDFIEIALLNAPAVDAAHTRALLEKHDMRAVASLGLPEHAWASVNPDGAIAHLKQAIEVAAAMGCEALSGVTYGGIGERTGVPPTMAEYDNIAIALSAAAKHAKDAGILFGIEPVNRYENHLINTGAQATWMIEKVGSDNIFVHLDTYHMNIEEKGAGNGILDAREHLKYIHLSESDRGTPGWGTCDWDEIYSTLAAIEYKGGLAMESFINMPPEVGYGLAIWRPVAENFEEVMDNGLPFLRGKARQYRLI